MNIDVNENSGFEIIDVAPELGAKPATSHRQKVVNKAILQLTDHFRITKEKFFRPLTEEALNEQEYGEIQMSATVNFLRYLIWTTVPEDKREWLCDTICESMKSVPEPLETPVNPDVVAMEAELERVIAEKKRIEDNLYSPKKESGIIL